MGIKANILLTYKKCNNNYFNKFLLLWEKKKSNFASKIKNEINKADIGRCLCKLNSFLSRPGRQTCIIHAIHVNTTITGIVTFLLMTDRIIQSSSGDSAPVPVIVLYPGVHASLCVCVFVCLYLPCLSTISARACVSQQVQTANTLTCLTHLAPEPLMGALYLSWLFQPLKQAPGLLQRLRPKPRLHSPHQPSCLFSEALEETLDKAYQIQTVARLCYFTHRPPLNSASFSVIVFFLAQ